MRSLLLRAVTAGLLAFALCAAIVSTSDAWHGNVTLKRGIISVRGELVLVIISDATGREVLEPVNGKGLYEAGQIEDGEEVQVRIVEDHGKTHKHRGHVTVLK